MSGPTREHCRDAVEATTVDSVSVCRAVYEATGLPVDGALLARALAGQDVEGAEVAMLAERFGDQPGGADAWSAYGTALRSKREFSRALEANRRAFDHRAPSDHGSRAQDASKLLLTYNDLNDQSAALQFASIAYSESKFVSDLALRGDVVSTVGGFLYNLGDLAAVEDLLRESGALIVRSSPAYVHLRNLEAIVYAARDKRHLAELALLDVVKTARARGYRVTEYNAQLNRIGVAVKAGDAVAASRLLDETPPAVSAADLIREKFARARILGLRGADEAALAVFDTIVVDKAPVWTARIAAYRGRALAHLGRKREAEAELLAAIAYVDQVRSGIGIDALKPWFVTDWRHAFDDLFLLYVGEGRFIDALQVVQRTTARSLVDGLAAAEPASSQPVFERSARRLEGLRSLLRSTRLSPSSALRDVRTLLDAVGARHVISFYVADKTLWRIVTQGQSPPEIAAVARLDDLKPSIDRMVEKPDDRQAARELGARLFPLGVLPPRGATLYVALTEPISHLTVASLIVEEDFLVQRHAVALIPNLTVLAQLASLPAGGSASVVIGDANGDLPQAREEAVMVAAALGVTPHIGTAARTELLSTARPRVLHVATHTQATPAGPALALADGFATAGDIVDRGVSASVVVLTSCASADPLARDELGSLANAFLAAGSRAVVAALWSIEDGNARTFAAHFYAANGDTAPVTATAEAQRRMIAAGMPTRAWSGFVVFGDETAKEIR